MNKMRKKLSMIVLGVVLVMALSVTAFASSAWDSFSTKLPANQGDTEVKKKQTTIYVVKGNLSIFIHVCFLYVFAVLEFAFNLSHL